ncbi:MAG: WD40 repeat domain-containing protein [Betaproteobacteria bacterium]
MLAGIHEFGTTTLAFTPDGREFISGGFQGELRVWDAATLHPLAEDLGHRSAVRAILPLASGDFVSGGDDGRLILWHENRIKAQVQGTKVTALTLFRGWVVSGHQDRQLRVWSTDRLQPVRDIPLPGNVVALSVHGNQLAVGLDHAILLLDADFGTRRTINATHTPHDLQFSPDGRTLAAGNWFRLAVWDVASGTERTIPTEHNGLLTSISFSPNGRYLATLGRQTDSAVRIVDTKDFRVVQRYQAHALCGSIIRFSPDGHTLASGSDDESVRLYDLDRARYSSSGAIPSAH